MRAAMLLFSLISVSAATAAEGPSWSTGFRTEARVGLDSNLFLQDNVPLAAGQTARGVPVRAKATETVLGAIATLRRRPATETGLAAEVAYGFEWHRFDAFRAESHRDHRLVASLHENSLAWVTDAKLNVLEIDGSTQGPIFNEQGGVPAIGGEPVRSRHAQSIVNASAFALWHPGGALRLRGNLAVLSHDFHTRHDAITVGCANYVDRGQAIAGLDAGRAIGDDVTVWSSLRAGRQWQSNLLGRVDNFTNTLLRPLVGIEGRVTRTVRLTAWAGPDHHRFTAERRAGTDATRTMPFLETSATWTASTADSVMLSAREQLWLGSSGRSAYREFRGETAWAHHFSPLLDTTLRFGAQHGNFAGFAATPRNDSIFATALTTGAQLTRTYRLEAGVTREWAQTRIPTTAGRAYVDWRSVLGLARAW